MLEIGTVLDGKYKILSEVGKGGMSVVYLAINERANQTYAIKEVRKDGVMNFEAVHQGLIAETNILKSLKHSHLPRIHDVIDTNDSFVIVMDYIEGRSLLKVLKESHAQLSDEVIADWSLQLCDVLGYLHTREKPIIYRDMKPANVMLTPPDDDFPNGKITLIDFGTAREYKTSKSGDTSIMGTFDFAAPEQFGNQGQTDARTDIFNLGGTIYNLITGLTPKSAKTEYHMVPISQLRPDLEMSGWDEIIAKCTATERNDRYQSCEELKYDIEHRDTLNRKTIKSMKQKVALFISTVVLMVVSLLFSAFGAVAAENTKKKNYDNMLTSANSVQAYHEVILTDPSRTEAYLGTDENKGLLAYLVEDGVLSSSEGATLAQLKVGIEQSDSSGFNSTVNVMEQLKRDNPDGYQRVCYEIGETYLYYYDVSVEKDRYQVAASWFKDAVDLYPVAKIYCDISNCLQNVNKYFNTNQTAKLYEEYQNLWNEVSILYQESQSLDDDMKLQVWNEIVKMIDNNAKEFCQVSSQNEIKSLLSQISSGSATITNVFLQDGIAQLKSNIEATTAQVDTFRA